MTKIKSWLPYIFIVILVSSIVLLPSFNLHLSGDDYQSLWKYRLYQNNITSIGWSKIGYFLSDYGPQDTIMNTIYSVFGLHPIYFYLISYLLRIAAALSFIPLVMTLTKNKSGAFISALFFSVATTGLESTDWVFNMPSYIAITFLNFFLIFFNKLENKSTFLNVSLSLLFFFLSFVFMPIRLIFLPILVICVKFLSIIRKLSLKYLATSFFHLMLFGILTITIFTSSHIGHTIGVSTDTLQKTGSSWTKNVQSYYSGLFELAKEKRYEVFLFPVGQLGSIIIPTNLIKTSWIPYVSQFYSLLVILSLVITYLVLKVITIAYDNISSKQLKVSFLAAISWSGYVWYLFTLGKLHTYPISVPNSLLCGGQFIIIISTILLEQKKSSETFKLVLTSLILIVLSIIPFWIRSPHSILLTFHRYLIVPGAGFALLLGIFVAKAKNKFPAAVLCIGIISLHMFGSFYYLYRLSTYRGIKNTDDIRHSIPNVFTEEKLNKPMLFYFEPEGSPFLYHSFLFGFPVIMSIQYDFLNNANLAYTDNWSEVVSAFQTGDSLKRFGVAKQEPVEIDSIYSFSLMGYKLYDTTEATRSKLRALKNADQTFGLTFSK
jgi:hypothetical protein